MEVRSKNQTHPSGANVTVPPNRVKRWIFVEGECFRHEISAESSFDRGGGGDTSGVAEVR